LFAGTDAGVDHVQEEHVEQYMIKMKDITIYTTKTTFIKMIEERFS
jgi:hypothetical protein